MSDSNLSTLAYVAETIWGTTPASPALKKLRLTGESITHNKSTVESEEVRDDRQISDLVEVHSEASGAVNFELSYTAFQAFLEAAMFNTITVINETVSCTITAGVAATGVLTLTGNAADTETVTIGTKVYTFVASLTAGGSQNEVLVGASASDSLDNLIAAINEAAGEGTTYGNGTVGHLDVTAAAGAGDTMDLTAASEGTDGDAIVTTETLGNGSFGGGTLSGGVEPLVTGSASDFDNVPIGATVKIAGSTETDNNGLKLVTDRAANGSTLTFARGSFSADVGSESLTFTGNHLPNGTTRKSFTIERSILNTNANANYQVYRGMMVDQASLNFESRAIVTGALTFLGSLGVDGANTSIDSDGVYTDADAGDVVNATSHVGTFLFDREVTNERFKTVALNIANNLRGKDAIGEKGNFDIGVGSFQVTGNLNAYFQNPRLHQKFIAHDDLAISFRVTDPDGNTLVVTLPRIKTSSGTPQIEAKDTDVMVDSAMTAIKDDTTGFTMCLDFHPA